MGNKQEKPLCYFDIQVGKNPVKRIVFELFYDDCPKTCENFQWLCKGGKISKDQKQLKYEGTNFHRCVTGFMVQGGDITNGDGTGGMSIYNKQFKDENFKLKHHKRGMLSMANCDNVHVVFGQVIQGYDCLDEIESVSTEWGDPKQNIQIIQSGILEQQ